MWAMTTYAYAALVKVYPKQPESIGIVSYVNISRHLTLSAFIPVYRFVEVMMKWILWIVGVVLVLMGAVWFLQGMNVIPVGFMAGQPQYVILGLIIAAVGVALIILANRRSHSSSTTAKPPSDRN
jgi:uncharacterized integral membrane protein